MAAYSTSLSLDRRIHLAQITSMDTNIGKILDELDTRDLTDNTIVWFLSDNGGTSFFGGSNTPLRNGKGSVYDGGIRTPSVVRYPDGGLPANTLVDQLVSHVDILPTLRGFIANAAGPLQPTVRTLDGIDMSAFLAGTASGSPPAKEHFTIRDQYFDDALPPDYSLVRYDPSLDKLWKLLWLGEEFDLAAYEGGTTGATIKLYDLSLNPGEDDAQLVVDPILEASLVAGLGAWVDLAPPDAGYTQDTSGWFAIPNYAFRDLPTPCDELLVLYAGTASSNFQRLASIDPATGTITTFNETRNLPDGMDDLDLQGIGRSPIDGLVYAITTDGQEVYQLDGSELAGYGVPGVLLHLGSTTGIPPGASITAGDVSPDGSLYVVFDDANDIIYAIELRNLVATATSVGFTGAVQLADMAFDSAGSLRAYEESQDRVLTIDPSGNVSASPHTYPLGSTGAVWIDDNDDLIVWKRETDKVILIGTPAYQRGLYHLELATGAITLLTTVPKTWRIDGAGCLSGP